MARYEERNFAERTEVTVVFVLIGLSYFFLVTPLLADVHPVFAASGERLVADRFLNTPLDWGAVPYLFVGLWLYVRIRRRVVGPFETVGTESE